MRGVTVFTGKGYNEVEVGDTFSAAVTVTETHLMLAAGLIGDFPNMAAVSWV